MLVQRYKQLEVLEEIKERELLEFLARVVNTLFE